MVKRVAVIGAGASGLTSIKCCLDEGLEPVCYEKSDSIGGIWNYTDEPKQMQATVYRYTENKYCNKELMQNKDVSILVILHVTTVVVLIYSKSIIKLFSVALILKCYNYTPEIWTCSKVKKKTLRAILFNVLACTGLPLTKMLALCVQLA